MFSFAKAIQQTALEMWKRNETNVEKVQKLLYNRATLNSAARRGE